MSVVTANLGVLYTMAETHLGGPNPQKVRGHRTPKTPNPQERPQLVMQQVSVIHATVTGASSPQTVTAVKRGLLASERHCRALRAWAWSRENTHPPAWFCIYYE